MFGRDKLAQIVGEFLGTAVLASAIYSVIGRVSFPLYAGLAAGITAGLMVLIIGKTSGAHINPAVTVGLWTLRKIETVQAIVFVAAQMLGGVMAWRLNEYLTNSTLTSIAGKAFDWRVFIAEAVGTFVFAFGVAAALSHKYEGGVLATAIGGSLLLGTVVASYASNGFLNPAVALGLRSWSWTYALAPFVGSIVGMNLYMLIFAEVPISTKKSTKKR
ncbi:aquaporin [Candidatus Saccharibacteria bacterium]|nr:aquaporin [Candidatus Saccharibacteria bacterium]MBI3338002.1 aquaporin [Candidatus Saccharibacteria bacterium]